MPARKPFFSLTLIFKIIIYSLKLTFFKLQNEYVKKNGHVELLKPRLKTNYLHFKTPKMKFPFVPRLLVRTIYKKINVK
jgi:hypothetical protein